MSTKNTVEHLAQGSLFVVFTVFSLAMAGVVQAGDQLQRGSFLTRLARFVWQKQVDRHSIEFLQKTFDDYRDLMQKCFLNKGRKNSQFIFECYKKVGVAEQTISRFVKTYQATDREEVAKILPILKEASSAGTLLYLIKTGKYSLITNILMGINQVQLGLVEHQGFMKNIKILSKITSVRTLESQVEDICTIFSDDIRNRNILLQIMQAYAFHKQIFRGTLVKHTPHVMTIENVIFDNLRNDPEFTKLMENTLRPLGVPGLRYTFTQFDENHERKISFAIDNFDVLNDEEIIGLDISGDGLLLRGFCNIYTRYFEMLSSNDTSTSTKERLHRRCLVMRPICEKVKQFIEIHKQQLSVEASNIPTSVAANKQDENSSANPVYEVDADINNEESLFSGPETESPGVESTVPRWQTEVPAQVVARVQPAEAPAIQQTWVSWGQSIVQPLVKSIVRVWSGLISALETVAGWIPY